MNWADKKVLVTGSSGFLGKYVVEELKNSCVEKLQLPNSKNCDLRKQENCEKIVQDSDIVFHVAGTAGGISVMKKNPAHVFYDNLTMGTHIIEESKKLSPNSRINLYEK